MRVLVLWKSHRLPYRTEFLLFSGEAYNLLFLETLEKHPRVSLHCYTTPSDSSSSRGYRMFRQL